MLRRLVAPGSLVVDAGANIGTFTVALAQAVPEAHVLSIEPIPLTRELLTHTVRAFGLTNVTVCPYALSDGSREVLMEIPEQDGVAVLALARIQYRSGIAPLRTHVTLQTRPLDDLLVSDLRPVSLLKVDAEMHELEMLRGARGTIRTHHPAIYIELQPSFRTKQTQKTDVIQMLAEDGYIPHEIGDEGVRVGADALDLLFMTKEHRQRLTSEVKDSASSSHWRFVCSFSRHAQVSA